MTSTPMTVRTLRVQHGQALQVALDAGTILQVAVGALLVRAPLQWLGERAVWPATRLAEGQCHALTHGGWYVLEAIGGASELLQHAPAPRWRGVWRRLRGAAVPA